MYIHTRTRTHAHARMHTQKQTHTHTSLSLSLSFSLLPLYLCTQIFILTYIYMCENYLMSGAVLTYLSR